MQKETPEPVLFILLAKTDDTTIQFWLSNGTDNNLCENNVASPLYIECINRRYNIVHVKLSLRNEADINLCKKKWANPFYIACKIGYVT